jgi:shikimate kinase
VRAVFLVGFMASGKSSVGQELARRLRWQFVDLDARIESRERQSIREIFLTKGEPGFRLAETAALSDLLAMLATDTVVALGGGTFTQPKNRKLLQRWPTVFLEAPMEELWRRSLEDDTKRPLRKSPTEFADLYAYRLPFYRQATVVVETAGKDLASICTEIEGALQLEATENPGGPGSSPISSPNSGTGEST